MRVKLYCNVLLLVLNPHVLRSALGQAVGTNSGLQIEVHKLQLSTGQRLRWEVAITNPEPFTVFVSESSVEAMVCESRLTDDEGGTWGVSPLRRRTGPPKDDSWMLILSGKSFKDSFLTGGLQRSIRTGTKPEQEAKPGQFEYRMERALKVRLLTTPSLAPSLLDCKGSGNITLERNDEGADKPK